MLMLLFVAACAFPPGPADAATALRGVVDLAGRPIESLAPKGTRAVVLFFTATDCPLANRYVPQMSALTQSRRGVEVWFVYPNAGDAADLVRAHQAEYRIKSPTALDTGHALSQWARATVTPEAAIFVPDGHGLREIYHGRIDDRYHLTELTSTSYVACTRRNVEGSNGTAVVTLEPELAVTT